MPVTPLTAPTPPPTVAACAVTVDDSGLSQRLNASRALSTESTERPEAMTHHTATTGSQAPAPDTDSIAVLRQQFGKRWTIAYEPDRSVWSAEQRSADGHSLRYICQHSPASLAAKLLAAETAEL
jgi:hypothetical protein